MTDFVQKLRQGATCLKYQPILMKFGHKSQNLGNYLHKFKNHGDVILAVHGGVRVEILQLVQVISQVL